MSWEWETSILLYSSSAAVMQYPAIHHTDLYFLESHMRVCHSPSVKTVITPQWQPGSSDLSQKIQIRGGAACPICHIHASGSARRPTGLRVLIGETAQVMPLILGAPCLSVAISAHSRKRAAWVPGSRRWEAVMNWNGHMAGGKEGGICWRCLSANRLNQMCLVSGCLTGGSSDDAAPTVECSLK